MRGNSLQCPCVGRKAWNTEGQKADGGGRAAADFPKRTQTCTPDVVLRKLSRGGVLISKSSSDRFKKGGQVAAGSPMLSLGGTPTACAITLAARMNGRGTRRFGGEEGTRPQLWSRRGKSVRYGGKGPSPRCRGKRDGYGLARALTRENSVPGQLTRKGMSSLSWGSARPPPDASRRPQRTSNTGPPGTRLRAPPPPSSILRRRVLQPPTQPPPPQRRGGGGGGGGGGTARTPRQPGPNRRHVSFRRARQPAPPPWAPPPFPGQAACQHPGPPSRRYGSRDAGRTQAAFPQPQFRGPVERSGFPGGDA